MIERLLETTPITDWLMVGITFIYVIATIAILITNCNATKAAKDSVMEMRREFEEANRPLVEVELLYAQRSFFALRFSNHGRRTAYKVKITLSHEFVNSLDKTPWFKEVSKQRGKECVIGVGQHYDLFFGDNDYLHKDNKRPIEGTLEYEAEGRRYIEEFFIDFEQYMTVYSVTSDDEKLRNLIVQQNNELKEIKKQLARISNDKESKGTVSGN